VVGVDRSQLLIVPSATLNAEAAHAYSRQMADAARVGQLNTDAALTARIRDIAGRLIAQANVYRPEASAWDWQVNVIGSRSANAFCMPGGKIAIYTGLATKLDLSDAEIAAVVGHEMAHALREHSRERISQQLLSSAVVQALANTRSRYAPVHAAAAQIGSLLLVQLPYSREMELEADVMGLELMARAGYDPRAASNVWVKMQRYSGSGGVEFLSTHPDHENRVAALEAALPKVAALSSVTAVASRSEGSQTTATAARPEVQQIAVASAPASSPRREAPSSPPVPGVSALQEPAPAPRFSWRPVTIVMPSISVSMAAVEVDTSPGRRGQSSFEIERMGRARNCSIEAQAWLVSQEPGLEHYTYQCSVNETWNLRCEFRQCTVLN